MTNHEDRRETLVDRRVTYAPAMNGRFFLIENVPARVDADTGEQLFSPQTVEQLQQLIRGGDKPIRVVETPVYQFA